MRSPLWSIPITSRPSSTPSTYLHAILFTLFFNLSILILYFFLLLLSPLRLLQRGNNQFKQFGKEWFGRILVCVGGWFVGTEFVVSFDRGKGEESDWVERDKQGRVRALKLPEKAIWVSNFFHIRWRINLFRRFRTLLTSSVSNLSRRMIEFYSDCKSSNSSGLVVHLGILLPHSIVVHLVHRTQIVAEENPRHRTSLSVVRIRVSREELGQG